jgi:hypothetical protein
MCPLCKDKPCKVVEQPSGKLVCECGRHSWPNSGAFGEACRLASLTVVGTVHTWTQSY